MRSGGRKRRVGLVPAILIVVITPILLLCAGVVAMQRRIYYPLTGSGVEKPFNGWTRSHSAAHPDVFFWTAWRHRGGPTAIMFHGNAVTMGDMAGIADAWDVEGWNVVLVEFPGYGGNAGSPSEESIIRAGEDAWSWAKAHGAVPARTVVVGNSIGTGAAVSLAVSARTQGLLIVSGVDDMANVVRNQVPVVPSFLVFDRFRSAERIRHYDGWAAVWHSPIDGVVPHSEGARIALAAGVAVTRMPGDHQLFWMPALQTDLRRRAAVMVGHAPGRPED
jgi:hypothetical protein